MQLLERPTSRTRRIGCDRTARPIGAIGGSAENMLTSTIDDEYGDSLSDDAGGGLPGMGGGFAQKRYYLDPETELYMLGMGGSSGRHYDPSTGRFISEDKIRQAGGDNVYNYVESDPINRHDASGKEGLAPDDSLAPAYAERASRRVADADAKRRRVHAGDRWTEILDETQYKQYGPLNVGDVMYDHTEIRSVVVAVTRIAGIGEGRWGQLKYALGASGPTSTHYKIELVGAPSNLNYADEAGRIWTETLKDFGQAIHETIEEHKSDTMAGFLGAVAAEVLGAGLRLKGAVDEAKAATGGPGPATPYHPSELPSSMSAQQSEPLKVKKPEPLPAGASPALDESPYNISSVENRIKPPYKTNPAHVPNSPNFNPMKGPEQADVLEVYRDAIRADMGTWYGRNAKGDIYRFSSDNSGFVHFSGSTGIDPPLRMDDIPIDIRRALGVYR